MCAWGQAVPSGLWLFAKRWDESAGGKEGRGRPRGCSRSELQQREGDQLFPRNIIFVLFRQKFLHEMANFSNSQLQNAIRELTNLLFVHFSVVGEGKSQSNW